MKAYCQETFGWIRFGRSEVLNSISLWTGKDFLALNFLKQESWKQSNIEKLRFIDFIKASTSVSVKFALETSITEMPTLVMPTGLNSVYCLSSSQLRYNIKFLVIYNL